MQKDCHLVLSVCFLSELKWHGLLRNLFGIQTVFIREFIFPQEIEYVGCELVFQKFYQYLIRGKWVYSSSEFFLWIWITMTIFRKAEKSPVEHNKLQIVAKWLDICYWRCKTLVGILLGAQDLLVLRDDIIFLIPSLSVEVIIKYLFISDGKKFLNDLLENLIFELTISVTEVKKFIKSICNWDCPHTKKQAKI